MPRKMFILTLFLWLIGCRVDASSQKTSSPAYQYIAEYAFSKDGSQVALIVPKGDYHKQVGLSVWKLVVLETATFSVIATIEGTDFSPINNIFWGSTNDVIYYRQHDGGGSKSRLVAWHWQTNRSTSTPFLHHNFVISNSGDLLVAWDNDNLVEVYTFPELAKSATYALKSWQLQGTINHVAWSEDDRRLLLLGRSATLDNSLVELNLETSGETIRLIEHQMWGQFAWDSDKDLVAVTTGDGINFYNNLLGCYIAGDDLPLIGRAPAFGGKENKELVVIGQTNLPSQEQIIVFDLAIIDAGRCK